MSLHDNFNYVTGGTLYWAQFVYQLYACYYLTTMTIGADSVFGYYSLHLIGELGVLRQEYLNLKFSENYEKDLKACIKRNRMIQKSLPILEKIYAFLSIWLLITCSTVTPCLIVIFFALSFVFYLLNELFFPTGYLWTSLADFQG